jgi:hypothetical protein
MVFRSSMQEALMGSCKPGRLDILGPGRGAVTVQDKYEAPSLPLGSD